MIAISFTLGLREHPATITTWHLCTVIIPRRTITGRLVRGQVWQRQDGRVVSFIDAVLYRLDDNFAGMNAYTDLHAWIR